MYNTTLTSNCGVSITGTPEVVDLLNIIKNNLDALRSYRLDIDGAVYRISDTRTPQKDPGQANIPQKESTTVVEILRSIQAQLLSESEYLFDIRERLNKLV